MFTYAEWSPECRGSFWRCFTQLENQWIEPSPMWPLGGRHSSCITLFSNWTIEGPRVQDHMCLGHGGQGGTGFAASQAETRFSRFICGSTSDLFYPHLMNECGFLVTVKSSTVCMFGEWCERHWRNSAQSSFLQFPNSGPRHKTPCHFNLTNFLQNAFHSIEKKVTNSK